MTHPVQLGEFEDLWVAHPVPHMSEPAKLVCWLTNLRDYEEDQEARLYLQPACTQSTDFSSRRIAECRLRSAQSVQPPPRVGPGAVKGRTD